MKRFPTLTEICAATTPDQFSFAKALNEEQRQAQNDLRATYPVDFSPPLRAICLPFHETRTNGALSATGQNTTAGDQGGDTIGTDVPEIGLAFNDALRLPALGARSLRFLRGNVNLPTSQAAVTTEWLSENATADQEGELFSSLALTPRRVTAYLDVTKQLMDQQNQLEAFLRVALANALAVACQQAAINGTGSSNQPLGILNTSGIGSVVGGTNGAAPTYQNLCDLEYAVTGTAKADRGNVGWLVSPYVRRKLRTTAMFAGGSEPIWSKNQAYSLLGHPAGVTTSVPDNLTKGTSAGVCSAILCGEFSELFLAYFGAGLFVETTQSVAQNAIGEVRLIATIYFNCGLRIPSAFAAMTDALAA